ncbi:hypothetical protein AB205_0059630, partial [Aquarana catesbeiana]
MHPFTLCIVDEGMEILANLSQLAGVTFCSPTGIATGSYQHILSDWLMASERCEFPPFLYFTEVKLQAWCRLASVMEEALHMVRKQMKLHFSDLQRNVSGRIIGQFMFDTMPMVKVETNQDIAETLTEGLVELVKEKRQEDDNDGDAMSEKAVLSPSRSESRFRKLTMLDSKLLADVGDKRSRFARELLKSERQYVQVLEIIRDVYAVPLKSALASNRAILSISNVQIIFSDILNILQIH